LKMDSLKNRKEVKGKKLTFKSFSSLKRMVWFQHFKARILGRVGFKVAWVTSGAPVEILLAFGIIPLYPENHSAVCAARHLGKKLRTSAISSGFCPDICSYGLIDIGSINSKISPVGGLARPDFFLCCNNICGTVLKWYQNLSRFFDAPILFLDTPFLSDEYPPSAEPSSHIVDFVEKQIEETIARLEKIMRKKFDYAKFSRILERSRHAVELWTDILKMCRAKPSPMTSFDAFVHMTPIVTMRGTKWAVSYYEMLKNELEERLQNGIGAIPQEKIRAVWDNIPVWPKMGALFRYFRDKGICVVADTYTGAWAEHLFSGNSTLRDLAKVYTSIFLNRGLKSRAERLIQLIRDFDADAFIIHSNRSCKPYSLGQYDITRIVSEKTGRRGIVIEADHGDPDAFDDSRVFAKLNAFFEL